MNKKENIKKMYQQAGLDTQAEKDKAILEKMKEIYLQESKAQAKTAELSVWRIIMKSNITKFAAAAGVIIAIFVCINYYDSLFGNIAFAEVLENIKNVRTVTWQNVLMDNEQVVESSKVMVLEPYLMRVEQEGTIWIRDLNQGKTLLLDTEKHEYVISTTDQDELDEYNTLRQLHNNPEYSIRQIGYREIDGIKTIGFELTKANDTDTTTVWVNPETLLPVRIEKTTVINSRGNILNLNSVTTDIVFDVDLDPDMFELEVPSGYIDRSAEMDLRFQTALNMKTILNTCLMYHVFENQWPDNLEELIAYGLDRNMLLNPARPGKEVGFVYIKPELPVQQQAVVLYEAYDSWGQGINVGFGDNHIDFIPSEADFLKLLE